MGRLGQVNLEFLAAAGFYLIAVGTVVTASSEVLPQYSQETDKASLNLEARSVTGRMLTEPGNHSYGPGTEWEKNESTAGSVTSFGLASDFLQLERDKIQALSTVSTQPDQLNYSSFKNVTGAKNQYRFRFDWLPTVDTHESFTRGAPPSDPPINEPVLDSYDRADNEVHYGKVTLQGVEHYFLLVAYNGVFNTTYVSDSWNFADDVPRGRYEELPGRSFTVKKFQNREREPGSLLILNQTIKTFGANIDSDSIVSTFTRFGVLEGEPLRVKIWTW